MQRKRRKRNKKKPCGKLATSQQRASTTKQCKRRESPRQRGNRPTKAFHQYKRSRDSPRYSTKPSLQCGKRDIRTWIVVSEAKSKGTSVEVWRLWSNWRRGGGERKTRLTRSYTNYSILVLNADWRIGRGPCSGSDADWWNLNLGYDVLMAWMNWGSWCDMPHPDRYNIVTTMKFHESIARVMI